MSPPGGYFHTEMWGGVFRTRNWVVIAFGAAAVLLGLWGFSLCHAADCQTRTFGEKLFRTVDLIRLSSHYTPDHDPWPLVMAQLMMPLALVAGAIRLFILNMRRDLKVVLVRRLRGHMVVCGLGETGRHIAENLTDAGYKVVAISLNNQDVNALACERRGIVVLRGDGMDTALLRVAGVQRAANVFVSCGSDAINIEIGLRADSITRQSDLPAPLAIWVELRNEWLYSQILSYRGRVNLNGVSEFRLFNLNANAARLLIRSESFQRAAATAAAEHPHLVAIGQGQTLLEVLIQAVGGRFAVPGCRLHISLISADGQAVLNGMAARYPGLEACADITVLNCSFDDEAAWPQVAACLQQSSPFAVVVDLENEVMTMKASIRLRQMLDSAALYVVPIFARIWQQNCLGNFLGQIEGNTAQPDRFAVFGDLQSLTRAELLLEQSLDLLACAAHESYRAAVEVPTQDWSALSERDKQSNRAFADHIPVKMAHTVAEEGAFSNELVEKLAKMEHWRWSVALLLRGWTQGPRDEYRKTHPLLKAWEDLTELDRETNREMVRRIPAILRAARMTDALI